MPRRRRKSTMEYVHQSRKISRITIVILWKWFRIKDSERAILLAFCGPYLSPKYIARAISIHYYQHRACSIRKEINLLIIVFSSSPAATRCPCAFPCRYIFTFYISFFFHVLDPGQAIFICDLSFKRNSYPFRCNIFRRHYRCKLLY